MTDPDPPLDRGLLLGDGLFETVLVRRGRPFRLDRHLARLSRGCERVGIPFPEALPARIRARLSGGRDASRSGFSALRITLTRGPGDGLDAPETPTPGCFVTLRPIARPEPARRASVSAVLAGRIEERALAAGLKATSYLERVLARRVAREAGADEALLRNTRDRLVEGSASNLFWVRDGTLRTPSVAEGALPGITREALLELADRAGVVVAGDGPGAPTYAEASGADEIFLTSALRGPVALVRLDERPIGAPSHRGRPGPVFLELARALERCIEEETGVP